MPISELRVDAAFTDVPHWLLFIVKQITVEPQWLNNKSIIFTTILKYHLIDYRWTLIIINQRSKAPFIKIRHH